MPDNFQTSPPTSGGAVFAGDDIGGVIWPRAKLTWGVDGVAADVSLTDPLPIQAGTGITIPVSLAAAVTIQDGGASITVDGTVAISGTVTVNTHAVTQSGTWTVTGTGGTFPVTDSGGSLTVDDGGGSLTVDGTVAISGAVAVTGPLTDTELRASAVTVTGTGGTFPVTDSGGSLTVDDGGGSLTVDGSVSASVSSLPGSTVAGTTATTYDYDTGAGTSTTLIVGLALPANGGPVPGGTSSNPLRIDPTGSTTQPVSIAGSVAVTGPLTDTELRATAVTVTGTGGTFPVTDGGGSLTVDGTVAISGTVTTSDTHTTAAAPLAVRLSDGTNFYSASGGGGGGGTQYTQDGASVGAESLTLAGAVRRDTAASGVGSDGDYATLNVDATGQLWVHVGAVDGTVAVTGPLTDTELRASAVTVTGSGGSFPVTDSGGSLTVDDGGGSLTVDGTVAVSGTVTVGTHAVTQSGTWNVGTVTTLTAITDVVHVDDNGGTLTVDAPVGTPVFVRLSDGVDPIATLPVSLASVPSHAVTNAGTFAVQATQAGGWTVTANAGTGTFTTSDTHTTAAAPLSVRLSDGSSFYSASGGAGGTQYTEDTASAGGESLTLAGAVRRDTAASSSGSDGDYSTLNTDSTGRLWVHVGTVDGGTISTITNVVHVDDNGGSLTVDGTVAVSGTVTVGTHAVTQSGTWTVTGTGGTFPVTDSGGSLTVDNNGTFAVQATVAAGATSFAKAEDVASADADVGVPAMAVRKATPANTSGTDGDYEMLQMSAGRLWVDPSGVTLTVASHAVTNAGTFAVQAAQSGTWTVTGAGGSFPVTDSGGSLTVDDGGSSLTVDGSVTVSGSVSISGSVTPGTAAANLGKAEDAVHADGDTGVMTLAVRKDTAAALAGTTGDYIPLSTNATGHLWVDASGQTLTVASHAVTNAGTFAVQAAQSGTWTVTGTGGSFPVTDSGGSLTVDDGGSSLTVDGTVAVSGTVTVGTHAVTQSGTWTVQPGNTQNTTPWLITAGSTASDLGKAHDAAHSVSDLGVLMLATRNDTPAQIVSANGDYCQLTCSSTGRLWVDGTVSAVIPGVGATNLGKAEDAAHTSGDTGVMGLAVRKDVVGALAGTDGDYTPLITNANGQLWVTAAQTGTWTISTVSTVTSITNVVSVNDNGGSLTVDGTLGVSGTLLQDSGSAGAELLFPSGAVRRDTPISNVSADGDWATLNVSSAGRLWASATIDAALPAGTNSIGKVSAISTSTNTDGWTTNRIVTTASQNPSVIKASAGIVAGIYAANNTGSAMFLKLYNQTGSPTSADTPVLTVHVPVGSTSISLPAPGINFSTGIAARVSGAVTDADSTNAGANAAISVFYK